MTAIHTDDPLRGPWAWVKKVTLMTSYSWLGSVFLLRVPLISKSISIAQSEPRWPDEIRWTADWNWVKMQEYLTFQHIVSLESRSKHWSSKNVPGRSPYDAERQKRGVCLPCSFVFSLVSVTGHWEGPFFSPVGQSSPAFPEGLQVWFTSSLCK